MRYQRALLRFLLLVLCLNTTVGMALHNASHFGTHEAARLAQVLVDDGSTGDDSSGSSESRDSDRGACDHCRAYAAQVPWLDRPVSIEMPAQARVLPRAMAELGVIPSPDRWRFAARDPPAAA